jgi:hypothetical protein
MGGTAGSGSAAIIAAVITSSLSFLGVVAGLIWNAYAQRRADERKATYEREKDENDIKRRIRVLRATLRAELYNLAITFDGEIKFAEGPAYPYTWVPIGDFFASFDKTRPDLGLLTPEEVDAVMDAYYNFQEQVGYIARNGDLKLDPVRSIGYPLDDKEKQVWLIDSLRTIVDSVRAAVDAIDKAAGRTPVIWQDKIPASVTDPRLQSSGSLSHTNQSQRESPLRTA